MKDYFINKLSLVVSIFNEEDMLPLFLQELAKTIHSLNTPTEVIFINDGSLDGSQEILESFKFEEKNHSIKIIEFSRNFGHESAMIAGIDHAKGDAIICLDSDLQHPLDKIVEMMQSYLNGYDVVNMIRVERQDNGLLKKLFSSLFYKIHNVISQYEFEKNGSDFFLISKEIAEILRVNFRERNRFLRGYIQIIGFDKTIIHYTAKKRAKGRSKYSFNKLFVLSLTGLISFSKSPLYLSLIIGGMFFIFSLFIGIFSGLVYIFGNETPSGYTTIIVFLSFNFAILYILIGILSIYIGNNLDETRKRPIYIIKQMKTF